MKVKPVIFFCLQINDRGLLIDSSQRNAIIVMNVAEQFQPIIILTATTRTIRDTIMTLQPNRVNEAISFFSNKFTVTNGACNSIRFVIRYGTKKSYSKKNFE